MSRTKLIGISIIVSTIVLCGAMLPVSADEVKPLPNWFLGTVMLDGEPAPSGTIIRALIDGEDRGNVTVKLPGEYNHLRVVGDSTDNNKPIKFMVGESLANEEGTWIAGITPGAQGLNLIAGGAPAGDIIYPEITITAPTPGASFTTTTVTVSGTASDNEGVSKVEVKVGSEGDWTAVSGTASWSTTVTLGLGPNTIYARANDTSGNSRQFRVDDVSYVVEGSQDTTPPTVSIDSPSGGDTFTTTTVTVSGTASDNEGVSKVEVKVGSEGDWTAVSGTASWSTTVTPIQGINTIYVRAIDTAGTSSKTVSVTVARNPPGSTQSSSGGSSGGYVVAPGATSTGNGVENGAQVESGEPTTTGTLTSAATAAKKSGAKPEENQGLIPGFEAVFAIAGLLVVAYLIRNRV